MAEQTIPRPERPEMLQTYIPFVEMYISSGTGDLIDILNTPQGKPRSLISFSHEIYMGVGGMWTIQIFDKEFVAIEELLFEKTKPAQQDPGPDGIPEEEQEIISGVMFRYGYRNSDGQTVSVSPSGEEWYYGTVHAYVPDYQPNGTYLTIRGDSLGGPGTNREVLHATVYQNLSFLDVVNKICDQQGWDFVAMGVTSKELKELDKEKEPFDPQVIDGAFDTTEEGAVYLKLNPGETPEDFLRRLWSYMRPASRFYNSFTFWKESTAKMNTDENGFKIESKKTTLFFGPMDNVKQPVKRKYVFMRDRKSDVLAFTPSIDAFVLKSSGASGMVYKVDHAQTGEMVTHYIDETSRTQKEFRGVRPPVTMNLKRFGEFQLGIPEFDDGDENLTEGGLETSSVPAPHHAHDPDIPAIEHESPTNQKQLADFEYLNYWTTMQMYMNTATLEVFGDPSPEIQPSTLVAVFLYVPDEKGRVTNVHWISSLWTILNVHHSIGSGTFTTSLDLVRVSFEQGSVESKAMYNMAWESLQDQAE